MKSIKASIFLVLSIPAFFAQGQSEPVVFEKTESMLWLGTEAHIRFSDKLFWTGEINFRTSNNNNTPIIGRVSNLYNRHGIRYMISERINVSAGGVLRLNFSENPGNKNHSFMRAEPRFWYEIIFTQPFDRLMVYHKIMFEHRWTRSTLKQNELLFRNRYRYNFFMKIPLNNSKLKAQTFYLNPDLEFILQSGKGVGDAVLEDLRIFPKLGYIFNSKYSGSFGAMYTTGQTDGYGHIYKRRWAFRFDLLISLDFRKNRTSFNIKEVKKHD